MILQARFGAALDVFCSDVDEDAVSLAAGNFAANRLEATVSAGAHPLLSIWPVAIS